MWSLRWWHLCRSSMRRSCTMLLPDWGRMRRRLLRFCALCQIMGLGQSRSFTSSVSIVLFKFCFVLFFYLFACHNRFVVSMKGKNLHNRLLYTQWHHYKSNRRQFQDNILVINCLSWISVKGSLMIWEGLTSFHLLWIYWSNEIWSF